jgi:L-lactate dehydrogenase (cytochrome)
VVRRHLPRPADLAPLLRPRLPRFGATGRLARCFTVDDVRRAARRRAPRPVYDYVVGAAEREVSRDREARCWERVQFHPRVLRDVSKVDLNTTVVGQPMPGPLILGPTGFSRMMHTDGERAVVRAAAAAGVTYTLSTMGTTSIEEVAAAAPDAARWFQLYVWRDRGFTEAVVRRAGEAGYSALVVTVDSPLAGKRVRDLHNGFSVPPALSVGTFLAGLRHPAWTLDLLTTDPPTFASFARRPDRLQDVVNALFDPTVTWDMVDWLRQRWSGPLLVKGITHVEDAVRAARAGVDGIVVSTHGGRQLDRSPVPLEALPSIVDAVGDRVDVLLDGGVTTGSDIVAALAFGARAVMVGRAYLYGLMAAGQPGVARVLEILDEETRRAMQLVGVVSPAELDRSYVTLRDEDFGRALS